MMKTQSCPLCRHPDTRLHEEGKHRPYYRCQQCALVFVPKDFHLSKEEEKAIYDHHENNPEDTGYRRFLNRLMAPLLEYIPKQGKGLDFGSGPGPTLSIMLEELGYDMTIYDPYFANHPAVLETQYDFITSTEVVEHLSAPATVFEKLFSIVKKEGAIGIMTKLIPSLERFDQWHYTNDPTHITFFAEETFHFLAKQYGYQAHIIRNDVIILTPIR